MIPFCEVEAIHFLKISSLVFGCAGSSLLRMLSLAVAVGVTLSLWSTDTAVVQHMDLPRPGLELVSPGLAGGFLTT